MHVETSRALLWEPWNSRAVICFKTSSQLALNAMSGVSLDVERVGFARHEAKPQHLRGSFQSLLFELHSGAAVALKKPRHPPQMQITSGCQIPRLPY